MENLGIGIADGCLTRRSCGRRCFGRCSCKASPDSLVVSRKALRPNTEGFRSPQATCQSRAKSFRATDKDCLWKSCWSTCGVRALPWRATCGPSAQPSSSLAFLPRLSHGVGLDRGDRSQAAPFTHRYGRRETRSLNPGIITPSGCQATDLLGRPLIGRLPLFGTIGLLLDVFSGRSMDESQNNDNLIAGLIIWAGILLLVL